MLLLASGFLASAAGPPDVPDDEPAMDEEVDERRLRGYTPRRAKAFTTGRVVTIVGAAGYAVGWALSIGGSEYTELQRVGYVVTRVGLPMATLGTFGSAGALDAMGYGSNRTAATAALAMWSGATVTPSPFYAVATNQTQQITWLVLESGAFALTVTQFVVNEVNFTAKGRRNRVARLDIGLGADGGYVGVTGRL